MQGRHGGGGRGSFAQAAGRILFIVGLNRGSHSRQSQVRFVGAQGGCVLKETRAQYLGFLQHERCAKNGFVKVKGMVIVRPEYINGTASQGIDRQMQGFLSNNTRDELQQGRMSIKSRQL
jgi:hypothetical protein